MRARRLLMVISILSLFASCLVIGASSGEGGTRAGESYFDLIVEFQSIDAFKLVDRHHLAGTDASEFRAGLDANETYGNHNGRVDSDEVNHLIADLESDSADISPIVSVEMGKESYVSKITQTVIITGAEGVVAQPNPDPLDFDTYLDIELFVKTDVPKWEMTVRVKSDTAPRTFYLTLPSGYPMNQTTFEPKAFDKYSGDYHINLSQEETKEYGYLLLDPIRVEVVNTKYVDPNPPPDDDVDDDDDVKDDDEEDDEDEDEDGNLWLYVLAIVIGLLLIGVIIWIYKRSEKKEKEMEQREKAEEEKDRKKGG